MTEETTQSSLLGKIAAYTEILQKDPRSTIFVSLAEAYRKLGHFDDARQIVDKGLQIHPDFSPGYVVLARILCQLDDYDGSGAVFAKALQLDENSLAGLVGYARLAALTEDYVKARELLLRARSLSPADPVINKFLNSLPTVEDVEEQETEEFSTPLVSETLADLYLKQGLPEKALEILRELLRNDPDNLKLRRLIRDAEEQLGDGEDESGLPVAETEPEEDLDGLDDTTGETADELQTAKLEDDDAPADTIQDEDVATTPEPFIEELSDSDSEAELEPEPMVPVADLDTTPLGTLNRWLENISKRRANV